jgi:hypothetical protein
MHEPLKLGRPRISVPVLSCTIDRLASKSCTIPLSLDSPAVCLSLILIFSLLIPLSLSLHLSLCASLCVPHSRRPIPILRPTRLIVLPHLPVVPRDNVDEEIEHVRKGYGGSYVGSLEGAAFVRLGDEPGAAGQLGDEYWLWVSGCGEERGLTKAG